MVVSTRPAVVKGFCVESRLVVRVCLLFYFVAVVVAIALFFVFLCVCVCNFLV